MLNYSILNDIEFEELCKDVMSKMLNTQLRSFSRGRDGGVDLCDDAMEKNIIIQVKHYLNSTQSQVVNSLKKEESRVQELCSDEYYVCCSRELSANSVNKIYNMFN